MFFLFSHPSQAGKYPIRADSRANCLIERVSRPFSPFLSFFSPKPTKRELLLLLLLLLLVYCNAALRYICTRALERLFEYLDDACTRARGLRVKKMTPAQTVLHSFFLSSVFFFFFYTDVYAYTRCRAYRFFFFSPAKPEASPHDT